MPLLLNYRSSLAAFGQMARFPFFCRFHDLMRAAHHREPTFLKQGGAR
jgi:hypothetical protein